MKEYQENVALTIGDEKQRTNVTAISGLQVRRNTSRPPHLKERSCRESSVHQVIQNMHCFGSA